MGRKPKNIRSTVLERDDRESVRPLPGFPKTFDGPFLLGRLPKCFKENYFFYELSGDNFVEWKTP